jgi:hypothetical protein
MSVPFQDNIILLPKTVDYYQIQLTRMLETEQYREAVRLLEFLLSCRSDDERLKEEWTALLSWLHTLVPKGAVGALSADAPTDDEPETEAGMLREQLKAKMASDVHYVEHLLQMLEENRSMEKQLLALEQLVYAEGAQVNDVVSRWVQKPRLHPVVRFRGLQVLKQRGVSMNVDLWQPNFPVRVRIDDTPLAFEEFPASFRRILELVGQVSEIHDPALHYFAEQTWQEFLAFSYGTEQYAAIRSATPELISLWAAAFHTVLIETMYHRRDEEGTKLLYGVGEHSTSDWSFANSFMRRFAAEVFPLK